MIPLDCRVPDGPGHAPDLAVGPRVVRLGQAMSNAVVSAGQNETVATEPSLFRNQLLDLSCRPTVAFWIGEMGPFG